MSTVLATRDVEIKGKQYQVVLVNLMMIKKKETEESYYYVALPSVFRV